MQAVSILGQRQLLQFPQPVADPSVAGPLVDHARQQRDLLRPVRATLQRHLGPLVPFQQSTS